ncbi:hypothetical protein ABPG77_003237 [Micractinium sp. CCAP 211/92]
MSALLATTLTPALRPSQPLRSPLQSRRAFPVVAAASGKGLLQPLVSAAPHEQCAQPWAAAALGCLAAALLTIAPAPAEAKDLVQGFPKVVDGDTLDFSGTRVRLFGIDAPETKQSCTAGKGGEYMCGERSKQALLDKIGKGKVECEQKNRDKYGRVVGVCSLNGEDLNGWLVEQGLAVAYRQYSRAYVPLEDAARAAGRGIWSGSFELPEKWRKEHPRGGSSSGAAVTPVVAPAAGATQGAAAAARGDPLPANGCAIKGNINSKGEKVYHVPGGAFCERTVIELDKGERYFCTAAEAEAAGWRASAK